MKSFNFFSNWKYTEQCTYWFCFSLCIVNCMIKQFLKRLLSIIPIFYRLFIDKKKLKYFLIFFLFYSCPIVCLIDYFLKPPWGYSSPPSPKKGTFFFVSCVCSLQFLLKFVVIVSEGIRLDDFLWFRQRSNINYSTGTNKKKQKVKRFIHLSHFQIEIHDSIHFNRLFIQTSGKKQKLLL